MDLQLASCIPPRSVKHAERLSCTDASGWAGEKFTVTADAATVILSDLHADQLLVDLGPCTCMCGMASRPNH